MSQIGTITKNTNARAIDLFLQSAPLDAVGEFTQSAGFYRYGVVDVQFTVTGAPTGSSIVIENSLDNGTSWVEVSPATNRTANGTYKESFEGIIGKVRAKVKTLTGGTDPTFANVAIALSEVPKV